jgi:hypothetical protein
MKRLNDDALLDKIDSLKYLGLMWLKLTEAEFNLRADITGAEYARKDMLCCTISSEGLIVTNDKAEIKARITIKIADRTIKDCESQYKGKENYYINLEEKSWENEPETYWGTGFFENSELWLDLFCTEKEMAVLQPLIFLSDKKCEPIFIGCNVSHPDHFESPNTCSSELNSKYMKDGWHQGVFCISSWTLSKETGRLPR